MHTPIYETPWKIENEIWRLLALPWVRWIFLIYGIPWGKDWKLFGCPIIQKHRRSSMRFGTGMQLRSAVSSNPLGINHPVILATWKPHACLEVGSHFAMSGGSLCAAEKIAIGNRVTIGANSTIVDTDFHPIHPLVRRETPKEMNAAPVIIEDDVFIGMNCLVLKGVTIGQGSVVGAGSVVCKSLPPYVIAAGNPARIIRELDPQ